MGGAASACSHGSSSAPAPAAAAASASPAEPAVDAAVAAEVDAGVVAVGPKQYRVVVHTGDSMVGGGLCKALAPRFSAEGTKFVRDVWEAASLAMFDDSDRLPKLLKKYDPDLVLITLGANDIFTIHPELFARHVEGIVKKIGGRDCYWIGPPAWKGDHGLIDVMREHSAPCKFFDSSALTLQRRPDGIHPTEKGGEVWAGEFWTFLKAESGRPL